MRKPAESQVNTLFVPASGGSPATLFIATDAPLRLVVRNAGGATLLLAYDSNTLQQAASLAGTFQLGVGQSDVFVLMPKQGMYAVGAGAGGLASIAVSEAIPETWMES